jgi:signal transduction histidine kinase
VNDESPRRWLPPHAASDLVTTTLFRALAVLRFVVMIYAVVKIVDRIDEFDRPGAAWAVAGVIVVWTALMTWAYDDPKRRKFPLYAADLAVATGLVLTTPYIQSEEMIQAHASHMPTFWVTAAVLAWAVGRGWLEGLIASVIVSMADISVKVSLNSTTVGNIFLLMLGAGMVGYTASILRDAAELRAAAEREAAATEERTRLARAVHDGVLQVLALVQRRGLEAGGDLADLGRLAGEQETALRALMQGEARARSSSWRADLVASLEVLHVGPVTFSGPGMPVELSAHQVEELTSVVKACLDNVTRHVGEGAPAWVLVEDLGDQVVVSVRDEGPGIPDGRLDEAAGDGRLGVRESIKGRMTDLGGSARLVTGPGQGTEWELTLPK